MRAINSRAAGLVIGFAGPHALVPLPAHPPLGTASLMPPLASTASACMLGYASCASPGHLMRTLSSSGESTKHSRIAPRPCDQAQNDVPCCARVSPSRCGPLTPTSVSAQPAGGSRPARKGRAMHLEAAMLAPAVLLRLSSASCGFAALPEFPQRAARGFDALLDHFVGHARAGSGARARRHIFSRRGACHIDDQVRSATCFPPPPCPAHQAARAAGGSPRPDLFLGASRRSREAAWDRWRRDAPGGRPAYSAQRIAGCCQALPARG